jgi:hypothetical protein
MSIFLPFFLCKTFFLNFFLVIILNFKKFTKGNKKKSLNKIILKVKKIHLKTNFFFEAIFLSPFLSVVKNFCQILKLYSNRPLHTKACCQKSEGVLGSLF